MIRNLAIVSLIGIASELSLTYATWTVKFSQFFKNSGYHSFTGVSFEECKHLCEIRPMCLSINYQRHLNLCRFNTQKWSDFQNDSQRLVPSSGNVYAETDEEKSTSCGSQSCNKRDVCFDASGNGPTCGIKECVDILRRSGNGDVIGNLRHVDDKKKIVCDPGQYIQTNELPFNIPLQTSAIAVCLPTGLWSVSSYSCDSCKSYLVSGTYGIEDAALTATSIWGQFLSANRGRLHLYESTKFGGAWCPEYIGDRKPYIQAKFDILRTLLTVETQGRNSISSRQWVTSYTVSISSDCQTFESIKWDNGSDQLLYVSCWQNFPGNVDTDTVKVNTLPEPVHAKCIRIHPHTYHDHPSMRFDVTGCIT